MNGLSLCSGIGGLDIAFEKAGGKILAFCELDAFCQKVLHKHWPDVPIFRDIRQLSREVIENEGIRSAVDIIYGGFPCQPFSVAGKQKGTDDGRYLWPEFSRLVWELRPSWVLAENVPGIVRLASDRVCADLEREGYSVGIWDYEAASVGAPHRRERVFFVAHAGRTLWQGSIELGALREETERGAADKPERPSSAHAAGSVSKAHRRYGERREEQREPGGSAPAHASAECNSKRLTQSRMDRVVNGLSSGLDGSGLTFWETEAEPAERTAHGVKDRVNRLKALGNAVVPQQVYPLFKAIMEADSEQI